MVAAHIVRRDLLRFVRNPIRTALLFALPLFMAGVFAVVFGGGGDSVSIRILFWDEDDTMLSHLLGGVGDSQHAEGRLDVVPVGAEGLAMMDAGEASALVHLPAGFSRALLDGRPTTVEVVKNPAQRFLPQVVEEGVTLGAAVLSAGTRVFRPELDQLRPLLDSGAAPADAAVAALSTSINQRMGQLKRYLMPPVVKLHSSTTDAEPAAEELSASAGILAIFLPGLAMMGTLFIAQTATRDVVRERASGLLRQLLTAPVSAGQYLVGKTLSTVLVSAIGFAVILGVGVAAGVHWSRPGAVAALVLASALAASGTLLLLMSVVGSERQGDAVTTIIIMVWCLLGGAFVPVSQIPAFLAPLAHASLVFWTVDGFQRLSAAGPEPATIAANLLVLVGCGIAFLLLGAWRLSRRITRGEL